MLGKRGDAETVSFFLIIQFVLLVIVFVAVFSIANSYVENTVFWKNYFAKDVAYLTELSQTDKGDVTIAYELNYHKTPLNISVQEGRVAVDDLPGGEKPPVERHFSLTENIQVIPADSQGYFTLSKEAGQISIAVLDENIATACDAIDTQADQPTILITAPEDEHLQQVARALAAVLESKGFAVTEHGEGDLQITFTAHAKADNTTYLTANTGALKPSLKAACLVKLKTQVSFPALPIGAVQREDFGSEEPAVSIAFDPVDMENLDTNGYAIAIGEALEVYFST